MYNNRYTNILYYKEHCALLSLTDVQFNLIKPWVMSAGIQTAYNPNYLHQ